MTAYSPLQRALWILTATLLMAPGGGVAEGANARLELEITGVRSAQGTIKVAIFDNAEDYETMRNPVASVSLTAVAGTVTGTIAGLPAGSYAMSVFHDENSNDALDTGRLGIPVEGYGFSNGASGRFGKPKFEKIAVEIGDDPHTESIKLLYYL